jgi:hypothetical protein
MAVRPSTHFATVASADQMSVARKRAIRTQGSPMPRAGTHVAELTVLYGLPEVGVMYADDKNQNRYFIDSDSSIAFELHPGQVLRAEVNEEGYVLKAQLLHD